MPLRLPQGSSTQLQCLLVVPGKRWDLGLDERLRVPEGGCSSHRVPATRINSRNTPQQLAGLAENELGRYLTESQSYVNSNDLQSSLDGGYYAPLKPHLRFPKNDSYHTTAPLSSPLLYIRVFRLASPRFFVFSHFFRVFSPPSILIILPNLLKSYPLLRACLKIGF